MNGDQGRCCWLMVRSLRACLCVSLSPSRVLTELVSKMRDMQMDKTELGCLRAIVLFNPGITYKHSYHPFKPEPFILDY